MSVEDPTGDAARGAMLERERADSIVERARAAYRLEHERQAPVLLCVDGRRASVGALRLATRLALRDGRPLEALVVEPSLLGEVGGLLADAVSRREPAAYPAARVRRVREQLQATLDDAPWSLRVEHGPPARTVARVAAECGADLVVIGVSRSRGAGSIAGTDTVARVVRHSHLPVLAVREATTALPHVAVAALDFSASSMRAARVAAALVERPGTLHLVHVRSMWAPEHGNVDGWQAAYEMGVRAFLFRLVCELDDGGLTVTPHVVSGRITTSILDLAGTTGAELIATGSHGWGLIDRALIGSVPAQLLHDSHGSVLVTPPAPVRAEAGGSHAHLAGIVV